MDKPFKAVEKGGYWICANLRTGDAVSYPTTRGKAQSEARFMNEQYAKVMKGD